MVTEKPLKRVLWFVGLWVLSVAALAVVAYGIKLMIMPVG